MRNNMVINPANLDQNSKDLLTIHALFEASSHYSTHIANTSIFISIISLFIGFLSLIISLNNEASWMVIIGGYFIVFSIFLIYIRFSKAQKVVENKLNKAKENHTKLFKGAYSPSER